jgi:hypothetical protein
MVQYGSCLQCIGATGTMWEPYGSCVGHMGSGWCHAPSAGQMGTVCTVWEVDGLWEPFGSMLEADGNIWELNAPYGGHMGAICLPYGSCVLAIWEPFCAIWEPKWCLPYGSHMHCMGAAGTIWEPYGSPVGHTGGGWHHMGAKAPYGSQLYHTGGAYGSHVAPYGRQMAPFGRQMALYGSSMHSMGPIPLWCHRVGAVCTVLELCAPNGCHACHMGARWHLMGGIWHQVGTVHQMGATGTIWEPSGSHVGHMEMYGTKWDLWAPYGIWELSAPYRRRMVYGSHVVLDGSHMVPCGRWTVSCGSCVSQMGAM